MSQAPELNKNDPDSLYNWVAYKISCPHFRNPIKNFIDENCSTFIDIDENSFEQGQLFKEMNLLLENLLKDVLEEGNITQEEFLKAAERGVKDKKYKKYFNQIINFGDYIFFKSIMTKRNYQIIQMAEKQMIQEQENENQKENPDPIPNLNPNPNPNPSPSQNKNINDELPPEIVAELMANEQSELNEAIKQSLADEEEKRRIAIIEEEEMRRAIKQSLEQSKKEQKEKEKEKKEEPKKEEPKKEEPKKEETKKEEPKKEETKKEEPKKFVPVIANTNNFQFSGEEKEEKKPNPNPNPIVVSSNKEAELKISSKAEEFGVANQPKKSVNYSMAPPIAMPKKEEPPKKEEKKIENEKKYTNDTDKGEVENKNIIKEPKEEEKITRDFVNIFEEKKKTLAPLAHKSNMQNPYKMPTLKEDVKKSQKTNVQKDIEIMKKKAEDKNESAKEIIKNTLKQSNMNKNDINYMDDDGGLLIDDNEEDDVQNNKIESKYNIHFGKIEIPKDFNNKIPDYNKEKQEQLKEYREKVLKMKKDEREQKMNN